MEYKIRTLLANYKGNMDKDAVADGLRALARDNSKRTKAGCLREVLDDIEAALAAGVSQTAIVNELNRHGLGISLATFVTTLKRLRKQRRLALPKAAAPVPDAGSKPDVGTGLGQEGDGRGLTLRERGHLVAEKYIKQETMTPLTKRLLARQQEKTDESSGD